MPSPRTGSAPGSATWCCSAGAGRSSTTCATASGTSFWDVGIGLRARRRLPATGWTVVVAACVLMTVMAWIRGLCDGRMTRMRFRHSPVQRVRGLGSAKFRHTPLLDGPAAHRGRAGAADSCGSSIGAGIGVDRADLARPSPPGSPRSWCRRLLLVALDRRDLFHHGQPRGLQVVYRGLRRQRSADEDRHALDIVTQARRASCSVLACVRLHPNASHFGSA